MSTFPYSKDRDKRFFDSVFINFIYQKQVLLAVHSICCRISFLLNKIHLFTSCWYFWYYNKWKIRIFHEPSYSFLGSTGFSVWIIQCLCYMVRICCSEGMIIVKKCFKTFFKDLYSKEIWVMFWTMTRGEIVGVCLSIYKIYGNIFLCFV